MKNNWCMKGFLISLGMLCLSVMVCAQQVAKGVVASNGEYVGFYEYKPTNYNPAIKYPVIIFLHGIGERGNGTSELPLVAANAIPKYINNGHTMTFTQNGVTETFLVLSPQLARKYGSWQNFYVDEMIKHASTNLSIDPNRIYLTGLSLGGGGVWKYASSSSENASKLAAIAPVCGTYEMVDACNITRNNVGVWAFHAKDDGTVGVGNTQAAQYMINQCVPNYPAIYTYYETGGHAIWDYSFATHNFYHTPNMFQWFMTIRRSGTALSAPVARAGQDQFLQWPTSTATLNGASSSDVDGSIVAYQWSQVSGPNTASILSSTSSSTQLSNLIPGTYTFRLRVTDNTNLTGTDDVIVNVANSNTNQVPIAVAGNDFDMFLPMDSLVLDAWQSKDNDGSIIGHRWSQLSGPATVQMLTPTNKSTWVKKMSVAGTYAYELQVTDNQGAIGRDTVQITIKTNVNNGTVTVNAGAQQTISLPTASVQLSGTATTTSGTISSYSWTMLSGPATALLSNSTNATCAASNLQQGLYEFQLTATNSNGVRSSTTTRVTVNAAIVNNSNLAPVAIAGNDFDMYLPMDSLILNAWQSYDSDGTIQSYRWVQIGGPVTVTLTTPNERSTWTKRMTTTGVYTYMLEVTDNGGKTGRDTLAITMRSNQQLGSVSVGAGSEQTITLPTSQVNLSGWATTTAGTITAYQWTRISGPDAGFFSNSANAFTTVSSLIAGNYVYQLTATNSNGVKGTATVKVNVLSTNIIQNSSSNVNPVAKAGNDFDMYLPMDSLIFDAWQSYDEDGSIVGYKWAQISGPAAVTMLTPNNKSTWVKRMSVVGSYAFRLEVTDNGGATHADTVVITMRPDWRSTRVAGTELATEGVDKGGADLNEKRALSNALPMLGDNKTGLFPNPATSYTWLRHSTKAVAPIHIMVSSSNGTVIWKQLVLPQNGLIQVKLETSNWKSGAYFVSVLDPSTSPAPTTYRLIKPI